MNELFGWIRCRKKKFSGLILANEILDALAVRRFKKTVRSFKELKVALSNDEFVWVEDDADVELEKALEQLEQQMPESFPEGYISEINTDIRKWFSGLDAVLQNGVMLFIDYGYSVSEYYHSDRTDGTLLCHYRHRVHADPFFYPGLQDNYDIGKLYRDSRICPML